MPRSSTPSCLLLLLCACQGAPVTPLASTDAGGAPPADAEPAPDAAPLAFNCDSFDYTRPSVDSERAEGRLVVTVQTAGDQAAPLEGVAVLVEGQGWRFEARTDRHGCVSFEDPAITPPLAVHAFAAGHRYETSIGDPHLVQHLRLAANPLDPSPATVRVEGHISNLSSAGPVDQDMVGAYARVSAAGNFPASRLERAPRRRAGVLLEENEVLASRPLTFDTYVLEVPHRPMIDLYALGGVIQADESGEFLFKQVLKLGYLAGVDTSGSSTVTADVPLLLDIDRPLALELRDLPDGPAAATIGVVYGIATAGGSFLTLGTIYLNEGEPGVPPLEAPLDTAAYGGAAVAGNTNPYEFTRSFAVPTPLPPLVFDRWLPMLGEPTASGRVVELEVPAEASWCELYTWRRSSGFDWHAANYSGELGRFVLPEVPQDLVDPVERSASVQVRCVLEESYAGPPGGRSRLISDAALIRTLDFAL